MQAKAVPDYDSTTVSNLLSAGGEMARRYDAVWDSVWNQPHVPPPVLELCRLRIARLHDATAELDAAPRSELRGAIEPGKCASVLAGSYGRDDRVAPAERAAIEFAEVYAMDPQAISDELAQAVVAHYGEPGLVALIEALGFIDGRMRLARMLAPLVGPESDRA
jgi:alkylhydroperoxidase family enzyme